MYSSATNKSGSVNTSQKVKICFVTNMCTHYVLKLFEILAQKYAINFYFTGGHEWYWEKRNKSWEGNFNGKYLNGLFLSSRFKISLGLFRIFTKSYDVIIKSIDDRFALLFVFLAAKVLRKPFILWTGIWSHPETWFHKRTAGLTLFLYKKSDAIIVYGEHVRRYLISLGIESKKIFCAQHSVDNGLFDRSLSSVEKTDLKKQIGIGNEKIVLYVGRLEECKGLRFLSEAMEGLRDQNIFWLFIGAGVLKDELQSKFLKANIKFKFLSHIPNRDLYKYYGISDLFVLPSITTENFKEPWGLVINEAMNQGCPVIATHAVGAAEGGLVLHGQTGLIISERDSVQLRDAIRKILDDNSLRESMARASKERISNWGPEETSRGYVAAINYVLNFKTLS